ncbi:LuxR family two component transcriptional regulator [Roseivivax marinus]|uniref:LuxR family two component transcriptional regulator n=1 Tax=Roseivivax marinus TaxID=1379903 RepID=W4HLR4_9RHOB|nr:autoinducer binding domain-containing protein [Roseivivax marinus]ETW13684.1 LuxR family two component transcriptional regulator [Roseivivax marinus]UMA65256.1 autoinducer binding domain-containing protein [Roseivivax marinus]
MTTASTHPGRDLIPAERYIPELLQDWLVRLEQTEATGDVWTILVEAGRQTGLPHVDFVSASGLLNWRRTLFLRTTYDANWLMDHYRDDELRRWSYFRHHALTRLTPVVGGLEFVEDYHEVPPGRLRILAEAAERGIRSSFSVPLRQNAPPQSALITFSGDHRRAEMVEIVAQHGWALHALALTGHQRYLLHFAQEFADRNRVTEKQRALLELIGLGLQDKTIAERLGVSVSAVRQRMSALCANTGVDSRAELAGLAMALGILPDPMNRPAEGDPIDHVIEMDNIGARRRTGDKVRGPED